MTNFHLAIVWMDHREATVSRFRGTEEIDLDVHSHTSLQHLHHRRTGWEAGGNTPEDTELYQRIVGALQGEGGVVITDIRVDAAWITLTGSLREVRGITNDIMIRTSHVPADQINMSIESALKRLIEEPPDQVGCLPGAQPTPLDLLMQLERDHTVHRAVAELWRVCRKLSALVCVFAV